MPTTKEALACAVLYATIVVLVCMVLKEGMRDSD